jgi:hydroxymethylpyrimidine pyrophosphatase-like HAD family hydrolase
MSIESDIYGYVATDVAMIALLGAGADKRIYWIKAPQEKVPPYIVVFSEAEGNANEEINDEIRFVFKIVVDKDDYDKLTAIRDRLNTLLDKQDNIVVSSATNYIYCSKKNGSADLIEDTTENFVKVINYDIKFQKKTGGF